MRSSFLRLAPFAATVLVPLPSLAGDTAKKEAAVATIESHRPELVALSERIWGFAETALRETRSAEALADYAQRQGFRVERGVAGMPTAFVAT